MEKVKALEMRPSWMIQVPQSNDKCPYRKHTEERHRQKKARPYNKGGRRGVMQSQAKKLLEPPEAGRGEEQMLLGSSVSANILISDFLPSEL